MARSRLRPLTALLATAAALAAVPAADAASAPVVRIVGPDGRPIAESPAAAGYAYPADGSGVQVVDVERGVGGIRLHGLTLVGGRVTLADAELGGQVALHGLAVDGAPASTGENAVREVPGLGYLVARQRAVVSEPDGSARETTVALRLHLDVATGALPAGTEILVGAVGGRRSTGPATGRAREIPPSLVPLYRAAGRRYGVPWSVLAAVNRVETSFGRNVAVSSAGAVGFMQFLPATWSAYGVDAGGDGRSDPYDPSDAIFGAARLLAANGAAQDLARAVYRYNHSERYVREVLSLAAAYAAGSDGGATMRDAADEPFDPVAAPLGS